MQPHHGKLHASHVFCKLIGGMDVYSVQSSPTPSAKIMFRSRGALHLASKTYVLAGTWMQSNTITNQRLMKLVVAWCSDTQREAFCGR